MTGEQSAISMQGVSFAYNDVPVLENVDLAIAAGESTSIVGPNGGGKTTLLKLMLGLLKPGRGQVRIFGQPPRRSRLRIGYMPQHLQYDPQFPITVRDIVLMGRLGHGKGVRGWLGFFSRHDREVAMASLAEVEMDDFVSRSFATLSGGQRQRVLIARALCCEPDLLLLDEPTSNVDSKAGAQLRSILQRLSRRMSVVVVSHDLGFVSKLVECVICVNRRVVVHPTSEITGEMVHEIYGSEVRMVRHDDVCANPEHRHG